jgi:hypothetical protein
VDKPLREHWNIKAQVARVLVDRLFFECEQIDQQRAKTVILQSASDGAVSPAVSAAAAAVGKQNQSAGGVGNAQVAFQLNAASLYVNCLFMHICRG